MIRIAQHIRRWIKGDDAGNVTIEFVLVFPVFMIIFLSAFEAGILMTRQVMLERAVDVTVRDLRLGILPTPGFSEEEAHNELKDTICARSRIVPDCDNAILLEMRPVSKVTWEPLNNVATCVDRSEPIQPATTFRAGAENEMMIVRACAVFDPVFPSTGLGMRLPKDGNGDYALLATSAFVNEPS